MLAESGQKQTRAGALRGLGQERPASRFIVSSDSLSLLKKQDGGNAFPCALNVRRATLYRVTIEILYQITPHLHPFYPSSNAIPEA